MKLSDHFTLDELSRSDTAERLGINNTPTSSIMPHLFALAVGLEQIRVLLGFPLQINSGYRCEALEKVLARNDYARWCGRHGKPHSEDASWKEYFERKAHPKGYAADFVCPGFGDPRSIVKVIEAGGVQYDQVIAEGRWVHVSFAPEMRGQVLTAKFSAAGVEYSQGA